MATNPTFIKCILFNTASSTATQPLSARSCPHSVKSPPHSVGSHPHSAKSHPLLARSRPHSARSHPYSARSHPNSARSHPHSAKSHLFSLYVIQFNWPNFHVAKLTALRISVWRYRVVWQGGRMARETVHVTEQVDWTTVFPGTSLLVRSDQGFSAVRKAWCKFGAWTFCQHIFLYFCIGSPFWGDCPWSATDHRKKYFHSTIDQVWIWFVNFIFYNV